MRILHRRKRARYQNQHDIDSSILEKLLDEVWYLKFDNQKSSNKVPPNPYYRHWYSCAQACDLSERNSLKVENSEVAMALVKMLRDRVDLEVADIRTYIQNNYPTCSAGTQAITAKQAQSAMRFAVSLWLHILPDISSTATGTLRERLRASLPAKADPVTISGNLSTDLCAKYLHRKADMRILWTDDLEQHLDLYQGNKGIYIFKHSSVLRSLARDNRGHPFPDGFLEETLKTLYLLFRPLDRRTERWNQRKHKARDFNIDLELAEPDHAIFELNQYPFWHKRLAAIQHAYDCKTPSGLTQWFFDTRNRVQWATFWVAFVVLVLTVLFGVIQCVTGIMQVAIALRS